MRASWVSMNGREPANPKDPLEQSFNMVFPPTAEGSELLMSCEHAETFSLRSCQNTIYTETRKHCFVCLSLVIGIPLSFCWGLTMAACEFCLVWVLYPCLKAVKLFVYPVGQLLGVLCNAIYGDCLSNLASKQIFYGEGYKKDDGPTQNHNQILKGYTAAVSEPGNVQDELTQTLTTEVSHV
eukprot:202475_1